MSKESFKTLRELSADGFPFEASLFGDSGCGPFVVTIVAISPGGFAVGWPKVDSPGSRRAWPADDREWVAVPPPADVPPDRRAAIWKADELFMSSDGGLRNLARAYLAVAYEIAPFKAALDRIAWDDGGPSPSTLSADEMRTLAATTLGTTPARGDEIAILEGVLADGRAFLASEFDNQEATLPKAIGTCIAIADGLLGLYRRGGGLR